MYRLLLILLFLDFVDLSYGQEKLLSPVYAHGSVVSASDYASQIGVQILKKGGNTVDAAIGVQFALAVVFPPAGNIGGGGFMMIRNQGKNGKIQYYALDFREKAPHRARTHMYLDSSGKVMDGMSTDGIRAIGVPGVVDGMVKAHEKLGQMPWKEILEPAIELAEKGFILNAEMAHALNEQSSLFLKFNGKSCPFLNPKGLWKKGDTLIQKNLGHTLRLIQEKGRSGFYEGENAQSLIRQMETSQVKNLNGLIDQEDLNNYQAIWREPLIQDYHGYKIIAMPPPSSGGLALFQLLHSVENYPLEKWGYGSIPYWHLVIEAERRVYADRSYFMGDPDYIQIPVQELISGDYNHKRMEDFNPQKSSLSSQIKPGIIAGYDDLSKRLKKESEETTHFSIADSAGNAVSVTTTLNDSFGSSVVADGGFILNNEMDDFSIKPGFPNLYGLVGGIANEIDPGKRMLSSMTPTLVDHDGKLFMVLGSPGGATIITTVFQTLINVVDFHMNMQEAVSAHRFHSQWLPDTVEFEKKMVQPKMKVKLKALGHAWQERGSIGRCDAIRILPNGKLEPGADPRGADKAEGF